MRKKASAICGVHPDLIRMFARKAAKKRTRLMSGLGAGKHYHADLMEQCKDVRDRAVLDRMNLIALDREIRKAREAMKAAHDAGTVVSYDLNFRSKLWSSKKAIEVTKTLVPYIDVLIGNEEDMQTALGIKGPDVAAKKSSLDTSTFFDMIVESVVENDSASTFSITTCLPLAIDSSEVLKGSAKANLGIAELLEAQWERELAVFAARNAPEEPLREEAGARAVHAAARRPLEIAGRNIRTTARRSMRPARW